MVVCTLSVYLYFAFLIERAKFIEYKSPILCWPFLSLHPYYMITGLLLRFLEKEEIQR